MPYRERPNRFAAANKEGVPLGLFSSQGLLAGPAMGWAIFLRRSLYALPCSDFYTAGQTLLPFDDSHLRAGTLTNLPAHSRRSCAPPICALDVGDPIGAWRRSQPYLSLDVCTQIFVFDVLDRVVIRPGAVLAIEFHYVPQHVRRVDLYDPKLLKHRILEIKDVERVLHCWNV